MTKKEPIFKITFDNTPCTKEQEIELQAKVIVTLWYFDLEAQGKSRHFSFPGIENLLKMIEKF